MKLRFRITNGELPAFDGFIQCSAIKGTAEIIIDTAGTALACAVNAVYRCMTLFLEQ